jgi:hypothetical protein
MVARSYCEWASWPAAQGSVRLHVEPLQQPTPEHLRVHHTDERLRTSATDRWVPLGIVVFAAILWGANFGPWWLQLTFAVLGFIGAVQVIWETARGLNAKLKSWQSENE